MYDYTVQICSSHSNNKPLLSYDTLSYIHQLIVKIASILRNTSNEGY